LPAPTHLLLANPTAKSGKNAARIDTVRALLDRSGIAHRFEPTRPAGATVAVARDALRDDARLTTAIAMGGDGTFAEVAKGILASGRLDAVALAMLPTGTANDQGKSFGLASDDGSLERNVGVIRDGLETRLDAGALTAMSADGIVVREDHFFDSAGWGISPRTLALRNEDRERIESIPVVRELWRDQLVYAGALLRTFLHGWIEDDRFDVQVVADGVTHEWTGLLDLVVKGTRIYGGIWVVDPASRHDDGLFEVEPFRGARDWSSKALLALDGTGRTEETLAAVGVTHSQGIRASEIELILRPHEVPLAAQIDGEEHPFAPRVRIRVLRRAIRLVVPREHADSSGA
jgi:diacylglycerol kinase family enzyme